MTLILALKIAVVLIYLFMFLRRPSLAWGIGLLTVTTAVLLDTAIGTFSYDALRAELGFFYFALAGALFAGATLWLWGTLLPRIIPMPVSQITLADQQPLSTEVPAFEAELDGNGAFDNQMLFQEIHERFDHEDVLDLMFDLNINENDVVRRNQTMSQLIHSIMWQANQTGQTGALALAVERILTPPPPEHLPRLEKINEDSPPTVLRQYLLNFYSLEELQQFADTLGIDWEILDVGSKREKSRSMLQYLFHRNRTGELLALMHAASKPD